MFIYYVKNKRFLDFLPKFVNILKIKSFSFSLISKLLSKLGGFLDFQINFINCVANKCLHDYQIS